MTGPLSAVLAAVRAGASSRPAVVAATGLPPDVVDAAVAHLERLGRVARADAASGCPDLGCGGCAFRRSCASAVRSALPGNSQLPSRKGLAAQPTVEA